MRKAPSRSVRASAKTRVYWSGSHTGVSMPQLPALRAMTPPGTSTPGYRGANRVDGTSSGSMSAGLQAAAPYRSRNHSTSLTWSGFSTTSCVGGAAARRCQTASPASLGASGSMTITSPRDSTTVVVTTGSQSSPSFQYGWRTRQSHSPGPTSTTSSTGPRSIDVTSDHVFNPAVGVTCKWESDPPAYRWPSPTPDRMYRPGSEAYALGPGVRV